MKDSLLGTKLRNNEDDLTLVDKILCCHGNLTSISTARVLGCSRGYVCYVWKQYDLPVIHKNNHRTYNSHFGLNDEY